MYLFASTIGIDTNLKVLESTLYIDRINENTKKRNIACSLWFKYERSGSEEELNTLIDYNKQDTINLYPIAEQLVNYAKSKFRANLL